MRTTVRTATLSTAIALLAAAPALAQSGVTSPGSQSEPTNRLAGAEAGQPEDVIVTAQKREESLIDVPQSISVVSGGTLERQQATQFQDYVKLIPGLQLSQSNAGEARLVLRGINTGGVAATVATYIDETPFGSSSGQVNSAILAGEFDTFDVARVEVLRGPQGTLYGASSLGGVLKFVTAVPQTDKFEGRARGSVESTAHGDMSYMGSAMLNVPLGDSLAIRGSGFYRDYGGFVDSVGNGGSDVQNDINTSKSYGGRVSALFKPSTDLSVRLTAVLQNLKTDAGNLVESDPSTLHTLYNRLTQSQFVPQLTNIRYRLYNGTFDYDFGFATITSSSSYSTLKEGIRDDLTVLYGGLLKTYAPVGRAADIGLFQNTNVERFSQEVRLASPKDDRFEWLLGGFYNHEKGAIEQRLDALTVGTLTPLTGFPQLADIFLRSKYEEVAGFGNATLHFGPKFDLTFGGRYSHNDQTSAQGGTGLLAPPALSGKSKENVFTWSAAPKFKFSDHGAVYARVAKGFRPGGPNILPPAAPAGTPTSYNSDSLISYEAGIKTQTSDGSFAIDLSAFHIDWKDIQLFAVINGFGLNANGGKARSDGAEFTATLRPTAGFSVAFNGAYTNARLTQDTNPFVGGSKGNQLPYTPKLAASVNGDYEWAVGGSTAYVGGSLRLLGRQSGDFRAGFASQRRIPSYNVIDLRAGLDFGRFSVEAYAKNLTDAEGKTSASGDGNYPNGAIGTGIIRPRTIGVTLGAGF